MEDFGEFFGAGDFQLAGAQGAVQVVGVGDFALGLGGEEVVAVEGGFERFAARVFARQARDAAEAVIGDALCAIRRGFTL